MDQLNPMFHEHSSDGHLTKEERSSKSMKAKVDKMPLDQPDLWGRTKEDIAIQRLQEYEPEDGYYVAFSGGKDSVVLLTLVEKAGVKYDAHFRVVGGVDPPEAIRYIKDVWVPRGVSMEFPVDPWNPEKRLTMWSLIEQKLAPPTKGRRFCCFYLKEPGGDGRVVVTGVRWEESFNRRSRRVVESCYNNGRGRMFVNPIIDWTEQDVWDYIEQENIPRPPLYGEPVTLNGEPLRRKDGSIIYRNRLGCVMCPLKERKLILADAERWPHIANAYKNACQRAINRRHELGDGNGRIPLDKLEWKNGNELYEWWLRDDPNSIKEDDPDEDNYLFRFTEDDGGSVE